MTAATHRKTTIASATGVPATTAAATETMTQKAARYVSAGIRLALGWIFLWAFLDKLLALGFATGRNPETGVADRFGDAAWINGGSPTDGFLQFGLHTKEPFTGFYEGLVGSTFIEWAYMLSMVAIGVALLLGITTRLAAGFGVFWMALFYTASALSPENNPFLDDHVVYAIVLVGIAVVGAGRFLGLGRRWEQIGFVKKYPILR
jgi:thiosulfate dehydrogenase (quinone) large subunit